MAIPAGASELGGGLLTATGIAEPLGPIMVVGAMTVATAVHRKSGPLASKGGYEMALTNLALASVLLTSSRGDRVGWRLPTGLTAIASVGAVALTAVSLGKLLTHRDAPTPADEPAAEPEVDAEPAREPTA